jgi:hypothetical protein
MEKITSTRMIVILAVSLNLVIELMDVIRLPSW